MVSKKPMNLLPQFLFLRKFTKFDKIYIFFTSYGFYYLFIILILFIISLTYGHSLAFTGTFVFLAIYMVSAIYTNFNLKGAYIASEGSRKRYFAGPITEIDFKIYNSSSIDRYDIQISLGKFQSDKSYCLKKDHQEDVSIKLENMRRGKYKIKEVRLMTNFPFGVFFSWKYLQLDRTISIYPKPQDFLKGIIRSSKAENQDGEENIDLSGNENFHGHRNYREGDSWKHINWKVYAKKGDLQIKEFSSSKKKQIIFNYDDLLELRDEQRLSQLCYWLLEANAAQIPFGLQLKDMIIPISEGEGHLDNCLMKLAHFESNEVVLV